MNIVALDALQLNDLDWSALEALGTVTRYDATPPELVCERAREADALLVNKIKMTREVIEALPRLKYIGELATGYDNIDIAAAGERGIAVANVPSYSTDSVAQLVFALLLELCHHTGEHSRRVTDEKKWSSQPHNGFCFWDFPLVELSGQTMGIIGLGRIGQRVAWIARAFGMNVIGCSRTQREIEGIRTVDLDTLLRESDVVSLNCPLNEGTRGLINAESLSKMKKTAFLINTARGGVIEENALRRALDEGVIAGAAVDVLSSEPPKADNPLLGAKNIIITPHIAWATQQSRERLLSAAIGNLTAWADGAPKNIVSAK